MDTVIRSRNCWFLIISELEERFELNLGYKAADNTVSFASAANRSARQKPPFGPPVSCHFRKLKNDKGQEGEYFSFKSKSGVVLNLKSSLMNNLFAGENDFSRKCTSLVVQNKQSLLAHYITLLASSEGFCHHRENVHEKNGTRKDLNGGGEEIALIDLNGSLSEFLEFKALAEKCAIKVTKSRYEAIENVIGNKSKSGAKKRKNENTSETGPHNTSKVQALLKAHRQEINDTGGVEQAFIGSYVGRAEIPIENIDISPKVCPRINPWKVQGIANAMKLRFDPSKVAITVAPSEPEKFDPGNLSNNSYIVISGNHTISALKLLDTSGELRNLVGMQDGDVLCYIINTQSPSVLCYGGLRSKDIASKFIRRPQVQDLLFVFNVLKKQLGASKEAIETVNRYAKLLLFSADDITALKKLCTWKDESFCKVLKVIEKYEIYETTDAKYQGNQEQLRRGMMMSLTRVLFLKFSKLSIEYFEKNVHKVIEKEMSLKSMIEGFTEYLKVEKIRKIVCQLSNYKSIETLRSEFPGKVEDKDLDKFAGAEVDGKKMNEQGLWLKKYIDSVISCSKETVQPLNFYVLNSLDSFLQLQLKEFDVAVFSLQGESADVVMCVFETISSNNKLKSVLMLFDTEESQSSALAILRSQKMVSDLKVKQILFDKDKTGKCGEFNENLVVGILLYRGVLFQSPLNMYNKDLSNLRNVILKVCPPAGSVAFVSQGSIPLLSVHSPDMVSNSFSYFGEERSIENFKVKLSKTTIIDGSDSITTEGTIEIAEEEINKNVSEEKYEGKVLNTSLKSGTGNTQLSSSPVYPSSEESRKDENYNTNVHSIESAGKSANSSNAPIKGILERLDDIQNSIDDEEETSVIYETSSSLSLPETETSSSLSLLSTE